MWQRMCRGGGGIAALEFFALVLRPPSGGPDPIPVELVIPYDIDATPLAKYARIPVDQALT